MNYKNMPKGAKTNDHMLDLTFSRVSEKLILSTKCMDTQVSDHHWVQCKLIAAKPQAIQRILIQMHLVVILSHQL